MNARRVILPVVLLVCAYYLPKLIWPGAAFFTTTITPATHSAIGAYIKLASLVLGAIGGASCARGLERDNPSRLAWTFLAAFLGAFAIGQTVFIAYPYIEGREAPLPSIADPAFVTGYVLTIVALIRFAFVYRASGLPIGSAASHAMLGTASLAIFAVVGFFVLMPVVHANVPIAERMINVTYPVLDFIVLALTIVMIRIALAFRPGRIWTVWAAILAGFASMAAGDILFAYTTSIGTKRLEPIVDLSLFLGYFFVACGMWMQRELLAGDG